MNWTCCMITLLCFLALSHGSEHSLHGQGDSFCDCDSEDADRSCQCESHNDGYKERVVVVVVASLTGVGVLGTIVFWCLYNKNLKSKWTKMKPEVFVEVLDSKPSLPHELIWTTIPSAPPPYTCTRLPYYHRDSRDTSLSPPPPYT